MIQYFTVVVFSVLLHYITSLLVYINVAVAVHV